MAAAIDGPNWEPHLNLKSYAVAGAYPPYDPWIKKDEILMLNFVVLRRQRRALETPQWLSESDLAKWNKMKDEMEAQINEKLSSLSQQDRINKLEDLIKIEEEEIKFLSTKKQKKTPLLVKVKKLAFNENHEHQKEM